MPEPLVRVAGVGDVAERVGLPRPARAARDWSERPFAYIVADRPMTPDELREFLASRVARWWLPDGFAFVEGIPRTSTGKFDKKALRMLVTGS